MIVPVTVNMLPSNGRLGGESLELKLKSMTLKDVLDYSMEPNFTYTQRINRDINLIKQDLGDLTSRLYLIDLDCLIYIKKTISITSQENITVDVTCPFCGKNQKISMNFRDSLEHCIVPDEALKVKEIILGGKSLKFQIPTIDYYQKVLKEFLKYNEDPNERVSTLCACLNFFDNPREIKRLIEDATLDEIVLVDSLHSWISGSRKFQKYICNSCGKEADVIVPNMSADMFRSIKLNNELNGRKLVFK